MPCSPLLIQLLLVKGWRQFPHSLHLYPQYYVLWGHIPLSSSSPPIGLTTTHIWTSGSKQRTLQVPSPRLCCLPAPPTATAGAIGTNSSIKGCDCMNLNMLTENTTRLGEWTWQGSDEVKEVHSHPVSSRDLQEECAGQEESIQQKNFDWPARCTC